MKNCIKCNLYKQRSEFHIKNSSKDRLYPLCKICRKNDNKAYNFNNQDTIKKQRKEYRRKNKEKISIINKDYKNKNKDTISAKSKQYYVNNRARIIKNNSEYSKKRCLKDINYKISKSLRCRIRAAVKENIMGSAVRDLGCSIEELKIYLSKQFYPHPKTGEIMNWDNWSISGWHIDHIKPLSSFDLSNREQFLKACHYTNLQPLWAEENLRKGARIIN